MTRIGIYYATREGQTRKVAEWLAQRLQSLGLRVHTREIESGDYASPEAAPVDRERFAKELQKVVDRFARRTGWEPMLVKHVAGAPLYTHYNPPLRQIMKRIAARAGASTDMSRNHEYTNWTALDRFVIELAETIGAEELEAAPG